MTALRALGALLLLPALAGATAFPGGFIEKSYDATPRARPASLGFVPRTRGPFTFPAPYNTQGVRLTVPADCGGRADCVQPVGYSYWALMNNHVGSRTISIVLNLQGHGGPTLFRYDKATNAVTKVGPLFVEGSFATASTEGWYFSGTRPAALYVTGSLDSKLYRYDIVRRTLQAVFDLDADTALFGRNRYVWQAHSSRDDNVHSFTVRNKADYADLGCGVYDERARRFRFFPVRTEFDECQVDASGRWLVIKADLDGKDGLDVRIVDLDTDAEMQLLDRDGAPGHSDNGFGYMVGADNWAPDNGSTKLWDFTRRPLEGREVYKTGSWSIAGFDHLSHLNAMPGMPAARQYACGSGASPTRDARGNELVCFRLDGSYDTLVVAPIMTDLAAAGGGNDYQKAPKASLDVTGRYAIWTSNLGTGRMDAFIAKIPAERLVPLR